MLNIHMTDQSGSELTPTWDIEIQPGTEGVTPALLIVSETGTVTIPLAEMKSSIC